MRHPYVSTLALVALALGCVGPAPYGGSQSDILEIDPATPPLGEIDEDAWGSAPQSCDGRLGDRDGLTFRLASRDEQLVAAVDSNGAVVCVDTVRAVQGELEEGGEAESAALLGAQFLVSVVRPSLAPDALHGPAPATTTGALSPREAMDGADKGDPTPQPNINPRG